jgi:hypothetical protein
MFFKTLILTLTTLNVLSRPAQMRVRHQVSLSFSSTAYLYYTYPWPYILWPAHLPEEVPVRKAC